jgi:hypothetical protein
VVAGLAWIPRCLEKAAGVPADVFRREAVLMPTLACVPFALASAALERFMPAPNLAVFFLQSILILPLVPLAAWHACLSSAERAHVKSEMRTMY